MSNIIHYILVAIPIFISSLMLLVAYLKYKSTMPIQSGESTELTYFIREGCQFFLKKQYKSIVIFFVVTFLGILTYEWALGGHFLWAFALVIGGLLSGLTGYLSMHISTKAVISLIDTNKKGFSSLHAGIQISSVAAFCIIGMVLLHLSLWVIILDLFYNINFFGLSSHILPEIGASTFSLKLALSKPFVTVENIELFLILLGFCAGASLQTIFARIGGGLFAKSADIAADTIGQTEFDLPEDDIRNPAIIADQVGDHVSGITALGSDMYESMAFSIILTGTVGALLSVYHPEWHPFLHAIAPFLVAAIGALSSVIVFLAWKPKKDTSTKKGHYHLLLLHGLSLGITALLSFVLVRTNILEIEFYLCILFGLATAFILHWNTIATLSVSSKAIKKLSEKANLGVLNVILRGCVEGTQSAIIPTITLIATTIGCFLVTRGDASDAHSLYGIGIASVALLSQSGLTLSFAFLAPISDNTRCTELIFNEDTATINATNELKETGNIAAAFTKVQTLFASVFVGIILTFGFLESVWTWLHNSHGITESKIAHLTKHPNLHEMLKTIDLTVLNLELVSGLILGILATSIFIGLLLKGVEKGQKIFTENIRKQLTENPDILSGLSLPNFHDPIEKGLIFSQKWMVIPVLVAIVAPILASVTLGVAGVVGLLFSSIAMASVSGLVLIYAGTAWNNTKIYMELNNEPPGSPATISIAVGDQIGDAFKDVVAPALGLFIKLMGIFAIVLSYIALLVDKLIL